MTKIDAARERGVDTARFPDLDMRLPGRWSPRAMRPEPLTQSQLDTLFEAARWSPSCFNAQPWRFAYATPTSPAWPTFLGLLNDKNQAWARQAGALVALATRTQYETNDQPAPTAHFDAGAAWLALALQAQHMGLVAHAMAGFDQERAHGALSVPAVYSVCAMVALGLPGERSALPEALREREVPSPRKPLDEIALQDSFEGLR